MNNSASLVFYKIWEVASSGVAIAIYIGIIALIIAWIIFSLVTKDSKPQSVVISSEKTTLQAGKDNQDTEAKEEEGSRFCKLCNLDQTSGSIDKGKYDEYITLRQLCENFRNYT
ncbi:MAG: hypothetical protein IJW54_00625, partial [Clostridia bacterium]|nr:hypothetical protein [Clostridia bacterium]